MKYQKMLITLTLIVMVLMCATSISLAVPNPDNPSHLGTNTQIFSYRNSIDTGTCWTASGRKITVQFTNLKCSKGIAYIDVVMYKYDDGWRYVATRNVFVDTTAASRSISFPSVAVGTPIYFRMYRMNGSTISGSLVPN